MRGAQVLAMVGDDAAALLGGLSGSARPSGGRSVGSGGDGGAIDHAGHLSGFAWG